MSGTVRGYDVFFSYNTRDYAEVEVVAQTLRKQGLTVFLDRWYLVPGRPWPKALEEVLNNCQAVSVFLGPHGMGGWQQREKDWALYRQAHDSAFPVIPVLLPGADPALGFLSLNTWVDMQAGIDDPAAIAVLTAAARGQPPGPELQEQMNLTLATICPYRGLRAFREEDAPLFFGRETFTARLAKAVAQHAMIAVVGASGCGKSSVVRAGLVPYLRKGGGEQVWDIATLVPGDRPLHALAAALVPILEPEMTEIDRLAEIGKLAGHFKEKTVALRDVVARILDKQPGTGHLLLVVDQMEELYTLVYDDQIRQRFVDELLEATKGGMLTTVLTLRGDFFGRVLSYRALADRLQNAVVNLGPMTREELEHTIEAPAEKVGLTFESGLVGRILDDVEQKPGSLPLLEFVLTGLWERRRGSTLLHEAYEDMGEVRGAMAHRADEVFGKLTPVDQKLMRRVLIQLVRPGEGTDDTRRRATFTEVGEAAKPVVKQLADARLTVTGRDEATGEQTVEVAHEALIHNWARLRAWMDEDREFLLWRQRLRAALHEWEHANHDADALLRGVQLAEAENQYRQRMHDLNGKEGQFIEESLSNRERQERSRRRRIAIIKLFAILMAVLAIGASLAGWYAYEKKLEAEAATKRAEELRKDTFVRKLAAQAELARNQQANFLQRSVLLAVESMRRSPSLEGDQALRRGLALLAHPVAAVSHEDNVYSVALSRDGRYLATASWDKTARVWDATTGEPIARMSHEAAVYSVVFSRDGKYLATGSRDNTARIWEATTGEQIARMSHEDRVYSVAFSPDGKYVATASFDNTAGVWKASTGEEVGRMSHEGIVTFVAFSSDSRYVATASEDGTAGVWEAATGEQIARLSHEADVCSVVFSRDGKYVATASFDRTARVWEATTGKEIARLSHARSVSSVAFSPDGKKLATASWDETAHLWDVTMRMQIARMSHDGYVTSITFSPNGKYVATASYDGVARIWEVETGEEIARLSHASRVNSVVFSHNSEYVATASADKTARLWKATVDKEISRIGHKGVKNPVAFSPDGEYVATASDDRTAGVWETTTGKEITRLNHEDTVSSVAFSPDGRYVATSSNDKTAKIWEATTGKEIARMNHQSPVLSVAFDSDGKYVATASDDKTAKVWEVNTGKEIARVSHKSSVFSVAFSPDGKYIATASDDKTAGIWEATTGKEIARLNHKASVHSAVFSPGGKFLATASKDHVANVWEATTGEEIARISHKDWIMSIAFSPDDEYVATASDDKTAAIWEATTGKKIAQMRHGGVLYSVAFSPDGEHVATASLDKTARIWEAMTGKQMARVDHDGSVYSIVFSPDGKYVATTCSAEPARVLYWRPADLVTLANSRLTRNLTYQEWLLYFANEPYRRTCANLPVHPTFIEGGRDLARAGDIEGAVAFFHRAIELDSSLNLDPQAEAKKYAVESLAAKGKELAEAGDISGSIEWFRKAVELDISLQLDPEKEARRYAAEALLEEGRELGEAGDIENSKARFQEALEHDSNLELDPEQEAHRYAAKGLVREGRNLVVFGDIAAATTKFEEALELDTSLKLDIKAEKSRYNVNMPIITDNTATKRKNSKTWDWTVFVLGPEYVLDQVDYVEYTLHPSFRSPQQIVRNRGTGSRAFPLSESGWGVFTIKIRVFFKNGHVQYLSHLLRFADSRP